MDPRASKQDNELYQNAAVILCQNTSQPGISEFLLCVSSRGGRAFVCAGAVRDALHSALSGRPIRPRDFDIGLGGLAREDFLKLATVFGAAQNEYGGYLIHFSSEIKADVWRLEDTVGTKLHGCEPTLANVLRSLVLDVNAIAFDPATRTFCDVGALAALRSKTIGLVPSALLHSKPNFAARAAVLAARLSFRLSADLRLLISNSLTEAALHHQLEKHRTSDMCLETVAADLVNRLRHRPSTGVLRGHLR